MKNSFKGGVMLSEYIQKTMEAAHYEIIEDEKSYWGELPGFQGYGARLKPLKSADMNSKRPRRIGSSTV